MDDITLKATGIYFLTIIEAIVVFVSFLLGKFTNGLPIEFAMFIGSILASSQVLVVFIIKKYFKIKD